MCDCNDDTDYVPEPEHVNLVMDGLMDSLGGNESLNLTNAQRYLQGVLYASGAVRTMNDVAGNEGFLSSIGDGIKKAWEYVKKMFNSIWDVFFKSDEKKMEAKLDEALKEAEKSLDNMEKASITATNVDAVQKKVEGHVASLPDSPEKKALETKVEHAKAETSQPAQIKELKDMLPEVFKAHLFNGKKLTAANGRILSAVKQLQDKKKELDAAEDDGHSINGQEIQQFLNGLTGLPDVSNGIHNIAEARAFTSKAKRCKEAMKNTLSGFHNQQSHYKDRIKDIESGINAYAGTNDPKNVELRKKIAATKSDLAVITGIIAISDHVTNGITDICAVIEKACVSVL